MFLRGTGDILDRVAVADAFGNQFTYGELEKLSREYTTVIPERSLVLIFCDYAIETVAFYYCQMINHAVPILLDKNLAPDLLRKIIETYEPQFIWLPHGAGNMPDGLRMETVLAKGEHMLLRTSFGACGMDPRLALLLTTSGSTGSIKLVRLSYENIRQNSHMYVEAMGLGEDDRGITTLPMHYCYGLSILHIHWAAGACVYVTDYSMLHARFWEFFGRSQITDFAGVSYTYDILKQVGFLEKEYRSLKFITQAGGRLSNERQLEFGRTLGEKGIRFYVCYGQTEATIYISGLSPAKTLKKLGSVGGLFPGFEASVENPDERGEGELVLKGPSVSLGYALGKEDLARGDDNQGILHTGDIVYIDEEGDIFIKGRIARFIKILGARVSLDETEALLGERFGPAQFACTGEDNQMRVYCTREGLEGEVLEFCRKKLSIPGKMVQCHYLEQIPRTSRGKIAYRELGGKQYA